MQRPNQHHQLHHVDASDVIRPNLVLATAHDEAESQLQFMVLQEPQHHQQHPTVYNPISYGDPAGALVRKRSEPRIPRNFYQPAAAAAQPAGEFRGCNCNKSHCLKLYCECFSEGQLCHNCNCNGCMNNLDFEQVRQKAIKSVLSRNPFAFHPKIGKGEGERRHNKGCNCKRSGCLKNYCECYEAKISCTNMCRCQGCKNTEESVHRRCLNKFMEATHKSARQELGYRRNERPTENTAADFLTKAVLKGIATSLVCRADLSDRAEDLPAVQERSILQEFGDCLQQVIEGASNSRPVSSAALTGLQHIHAFHHHRHASGSGTGGRQEVAGSSGGAVASGSAGASAAAAAAQLEFGGGGIGSGHIKSEQVIVDVV